MTAKALLGVCLVLLAYGAQAFTVAGPGAVPWFDGLKVKHKPQGTGNYKGKRDRHEKPGPMNERKRKSDNWIQKR